MDDYILDKAAMTNQVENRQAGEVEIIASRISEVSAYREITNAMIFAGLRALGEFEERKEAGEDLTKSDLISAIYVAMRRQI